MKGKAMSIHEYNLTTTKNGLYDITGQVAAAVAESGVAEGTVVVHCPHTTAALTINEHTDPHVQQDLMLSLDTAFPDRPDFRHNEGNSAAHVKSSVIGVTLTLIVRDGKPLLGSWQGLYFCEFDGPRQRHFFVQTR